MYILQKFKRISRHISIQCNMVLLSTWHIDHKTFRTIIFWLRHPITKIKCIAWRSPIFNFRSHDWEPAIATSGNEYPSQILQCITWIAAPAAGTIRNKKKRTHKTQPSRDSPTAAVPGIYLYQFLATRVPKFTVVFSEQTSTQRVSLLLFRPSQTCTCTR